jgi:hypothetical protein
VRSSGVARCRTLGTRATALLVATALAALAPSIGGAQEFDFRPRVQWEARADGVVAAKTGAQVGVGVNVPAGYYLRLGLTTAAGPVWQGARTTVSGRVDLAARYLLDPFREVRWSFYGGTGLTTRWDESARWRGYLLFLAGIEGPEHRGWTPAIEVGLGGGARLGVVLRRARRNGR